jgi:peptidyl-prolyl cis-trans isomerase B (cyclophilin B)
MKKRLIVTLIMVSVFSLSGCTKEVEAIPDSAKNDVTGETQQVVDKTDQDESNLPQTENLPLQLAKSFQLDEIKQDEEVAILTTNYGVIKMRFFEEEAPKTVENFKTLAKEGYYEGIIFHRVINDFMVQGGDPTGTGSGGDSAFGGAFEDELTPNLRNIRGAVSMANSGPNTNGSQFFIVQNKQLSEDYLEDFNLAMENYDEPFEDGSGIKLENLIHKDILQYYIDNGGTPFLDGKHTVFAQVYEGMDIVDDIASVEIDENDKPFIDVIIETVQFENYK